MNHENPTPSADRLIIETNRLVLAIRLLKGKPRLTSRDLQELARLTTELLQVCPRRRYEWVDGLPVVDIVKSFQQKGALKEEAKDA